MCVMWLSTHEMRVTDLCRSDGMWAVGLAGRRCGCGGPCWRSKRARGCRGEIKGWARGVATRPPLLRSHGEGTWLPQNQRGAQHVVALQFTYCINYLQSNGHLVSLSSCSKVARLFELHKFLIHINIIYFVGSL